VRAALTAIAATFRRRAGTPRESAASSSSRTAAIIQRKLICPPGAATFVFDLEDDGPASIEPEVSDEVVVRQPEPGIDAFLAEGSPFTGESPSASGLRLAEDERMRILTAFRCEEDSDLPFKFGRLLLDILRSEPTEREAALTAEALRNYLQALQRQGRVLVLRRLHKRVEPGIAASPAASCALTEIQAFFCDPALMAGLLTARGYRAEDRAAAVLLAGEVPAETALALLALLDDDPEALDLAVAESLRMRLAADHALQLLALADGTRPAVRSAALERMVPREEDLRYLREVQKHAEPEWRLLAVVAMARGGGTGPVAGLADALDDPTPEIRMAAAEALGRRGGHSALEPLLRLVAARGFDRRSVEERCCVLLAAGRAAPRDVWPVLARLVERRRLHLPRRRAWSEEPALEALARLPEPVPTLLRDRWRGRPDLRAALDRACSQADAGSSGGDGHDGTTGVDRSRAA
jgi:HEAT repeat protein